MIYSRFKLALAQSGVGPEGMPEELLARRK
jgi:hypothetical protein